MTTHTIAPFGENISSEKKFINGVFGWMGVGLLITAVIAYGFSKSTDLLALLYTDTGMSLLGYIVMFAPIVFVLLMSLGFARLSYPSLLILYIAYAAIMGASLSFIFHIYTSQSIYTTFLSAGLMFGLMALYGFITKTDLTKMGNLLMMALIGIIISSVINLFIKNDAFSLIISFISIVVFCGLTAWDVQKLKNIPSDTPEEAKSKLGILGALTLYIDFINLFLSLLHLTGRRKQ